MGKGVRLRTGENPMKDRLISLLPGALVTALAWAILWTLLVAEVD